MGGLPCFCNARSENPQGSRLPFLAAPQELLTPLHMASVSGLADIAEALLRAGARPEARSVHGLTPGDTSTDLSAMPAALSPTGSKCNASMSFSSMPRASSLSASREQQPTSPTAPWQHRGSPQSGSGRRLAGPGGLANGPGSGQYSAAWAEVAVPSPQRMSRGGKDKDSSARAEMAAGGLNVQEVAAAAQPAGPAAAAEGFTTQDAHEQAACAQPPGQVNSGSG